MSAATPESTATSDGTEDEDFRHRVAGEKRARMRERLIAAAMDAYLLAGPGRHPVINDVIAQAGVSRGTFYKYYDSFEELLAEIGRRMADEMINSFDHLFGALDDLAAQVAAGPLMALARAAMEPRHAAFIARVDFIEFMEGEDPRSLILRGSLGRARDQGVLQFESLEAAIDLVIGASVEGARRLLQAGPLDAAYIREMTVLVMSGLGLTRPQALAAVTRAWQQLQQQSTHLHWWRPLQDH